MLATILYLFVFAIVFAIVLRFKLDEKPHSVKRWIWTFLTPLFFAIGWPATFIVLMVFAWID